MARETKKHMETSSKKEDYQGIVIGKEFIQENTVIYADSPVRVSIEQKIAEPII